MRRLSRPTMQGPDPETGLHGAWLLTFVGFAGDDDCQVRIAQAVSRRSLRIEAERTLSGAQSDYSSRELTLSGEPDAIASLGKWLTAADLGVDHVLRPLKEPRTLPLLAALDMDSTVIAAEGLDALAAEVGKGEEIAAMTAMAMRGEADFSASLRQRTALLAGIKEETLARVAENLPLTRGAERLALTLRASGCKTALISGGFSCFGRVVQKRLGIDVLHANEFEIQDGKLTGRIAGAIVDGRRKAELFRQIGAAEGLFREQTLAVGDGANDLPMLAEAGMGIAFHAKPIVRRQAEYAISVAGLDAILHILGLSDPEIERLIASQPS